MSIRTSKALSFICAIILVFNMLSSVLVSATSGDNSAVAQTTTATENSTTDSTDSSSSADSSTTTTAVSPVTTEPTVVTTEPPVVTTEPPVVTTEPPVVTTEPPVVTTAPRPKVPVAFDVTIPADFPTKYRVGDVFSTDKIAGTITYDDGSTEPVSEVLCDAPDFLDDDTTSVSFFCEKYPYLRATAKLAITVSKITNIEVSGDALNATYYEGDIFGNDQINSLVITVFFADNTSKVVSPVECNFPGTDKPLSAKVPSITVEYCGSYGFAPLTVLELPKMVGIQIVLTDAFSNYFTEGDPFNPKGLMIMAMYSGGKNPEVIASDLTGFSNVTFSPALDVPLKFTDASVTVTYSDGTNTFSAKQAIVVFSESITEIKVSKNPTKVIYTEGDTFDYTGMELAVTYKGGTTVTITENFTVSHTATPFVLKSNTTEIVDIEVTYLDKSCTFPITVVAAEIKSLTVLTNPTKLTYNEGETFDPTGLVLQLTYSNSALAPVSIPQEYCTFAPETPLTANDTSVTISFRGKEVKIDLTVIPEETTEITTLPPEPITTPEPETTPSEPTTDETTPAVSETTPPTTTTTDTPSVTTDETTLTPDETTVGDDADDGGNTTLVVLWIVILAVIIIALVVLIIYYKRNFT